MPDNPTEAGPAIDGLLFRAVRVDCQFGDRVAIRDLTIDLHAGQQIAVMGPSGAGKSTLLKVIAGRQRPTRGTASWPGLSDSAAAPLRGVAMVDQTPELLEPLTVLQNVAFPLLTRGTPSALAYQSAMASLASVGSEGLAGRYPEEISGGQTQRVAVARALVLDAPVLLADEPTGHLDHRHADAIVSALVNAAARSGMALVIATHDPEVGNRLASAWRLEDGILLGARSA